MNIRINLSFVRITIRVDFAKTVRVKAYKRLCNGRLQKVRSHYRRY